MRITTAPTLLATSLLLSACFNDFQPGDTAAGETGDGDGDSGDGDSSDGDGEPGDGDGDSGDGDGDSGDGDGEQGDGDPGCQPGGCADGQYCVAGSCEEPPEGMVAIEAGPFWMGCNEDIDANCDPDEYPYHQVTLSAYAIDLNQITVDDYAVCVADGECIDTCGSATESQPVTCVSWFDARNYCAWAGKQLPTEAQWEKAARGADGRLYPWGNEPPTCALIAMDGCPGFEDLPPVGSYPAGASPYGVLDMAGGLIEWTADWYSASYYGQSPMHDPVGPDSGTDRVVRGGIAGLDTTWRTSDRDDYVPTGTAFTSFRCAYVPQ